MSQALIRNIRDYLDELCEKVEDKTEELTILLEDILAFLCGTPPSLEETRDENSQMLKRAKEEYDQVQMVFFENAG